MDDNKPQDNPTPPEPTADEKEWEQAATDFAEQHGRVEPPKDDKKPEDKKDEPAKPKEEPKAPEAPKDDTQGKKPDAEQKPSDGTGEEAKGDQGEGKPAEESIEDNPAIRDARSVQRQIAEDEAAVKEDIRKEMFSEVQTELLDADGDPIKTVQDVMKLQNPNTGKPFTEEEAAQWLMAAQAHLEKQLDDVEVQINSIADTNLALKDWADAVKIKYGEFLKANPEIQKQIWAEYEKTLVKDEKTQIITKAPVNLESFYAVALEPHMKLAEQMQKDAERQEQEAKAKAEENRKQNQSDRADVTSGNKPDIKSKDEKEWEEAAKQHYRN